MMRAAIVVLATALSSMAAPLLSWASFDQVAAINNHWGLDIKFPSTVEKASFSGLVRDCLCTRLHRRLLLGAITTDVAHRP